MRRDICFYFPTDVCSLYNAYLTAATNRPFERDCKREPYHTITFGLNFSMKYNMNGGSCILHFIPWQGGAAVDLRFVVAQLGGARYEKYAKDLTSYAEQALGIRGQMVEINIDYFTAEGNKVSVPAAPALKPEVAPQPIVPPAPQPTPQPIAQPAPAEAPRFCTQCGNRLQPGAVFCSGCGRKL